MKKSVAVNEVAGNSPFYRNRLSTDTLFTMPEGSVTVKGYVDDAIRFIEDYQLIDAPQWKKFVDQFRDTDPKADDANVGWRGEYWGKMMRGACFTYRYTQNPELYTVLEETVRDMMTTQDELGRISSYSVAAQYRGWDIWARKYVLLGMQYFIEICKDEKLIAEIVECMKKQADYMLSTIGDGEGKKRITLCTSHWRGLNSCSVLEPIVRLYNLTGEQRYLDFATYIVSCGGTEGQNIYELAAQGKPYPYQYNVTKAYEMMSCFEGLLEYYRVTGIEKWRTAVVNLAKMIAETDISVIGSAGCTHELFDHTRVRQLTTEYFGVMQETCVTVTWLKFCYQVLCLSGESYLADEMERSVYNGMLGAINYDKLDRNGGFPFDSYSPLLLSTRLRGVGGKQIMADGSSYGCCACIGSAGTGIIPMYAYMLRRDGFAFNLYAEGGFTAKTPAGNEASFAVETKYPLDGAVKITLVQGAEERYTVALRIPYWSKETVVTVNGEPVTAKAGSYCEIERVWRVGDEISLLLYVKCEIIKPYEGEYSDVNSRYHVALRRGPLMLARDARLEASIETPVDFSTFEDEGCVPCKVSEAPFPHFFCFTVTDSNGNDIPMLDYASAGRTWDEKSLTTVWMPTKDYWTVDMTAPVRFIAPPAWENGAGYEIVENNGEVSVRNITDASAVPYVTLEYGDDGFCRIRFESGRYLDFEVSEGGAVNAVANEKGMSLKLRKYAQDRYKLINADGKAVFNQNNRGAFSLSLAPESFAPVQVFRFIR